MQSRSVEPKEVFLFLRASKTSLVRYFFSSDLESEAASLLKPASNFSRVVASTIAAAFLQTKPQYVT